ncbi:Metallo-dependent phosphatase-like protein [Pisolithus croceorrhizus]|nr:Metallo-dependent phosphatase-like protein [Pisolithus croceorrhizus]
MFLPIIALAGLVTACGDHHLPARGTYSQSRVEKQEYPQVPLTPPHRPIVWGDFNVIHTTDTHGWLLGHQKSSFPEPYFSGDLGDFASFVTHMKYIAKQKGVDLLLIDSGDLHDGTGLSDGYAPGAIDAHESNKFVERLPYDVMTIGNHELYVYADTHDMYVNSLPFPWTYHGLYSAPPMMYLEPVLLIKYQSFIPHFEGHYLTSNVNITVFNSDGEAVSVPVGSEGRRVTSLGVLFNFTGNAHNTTVQPVAKMIEEPWFAEAIAEEPDVFILAGHMPVSNDSWPVVFSAIRAVHPLTPIMIFGGHTHIRDCQQYDGRSMAMESGRYMETIGWMSANLNAGEGNADDIKFSRRYLDQNRVTYQFHTKTSNATFDTRYGRTITEGLRDLAEQYNLSYHDPYPSNGSLLTLFIDEAIPTALKLNNSRAEIPSLFIATSGDLRFDIFKGPFTKNDQLTASPYSDQFLYIPGVTLQVATQVLQALNKLSSISLKQKRTELMKSWEFVYVDDRFQTWLGEVEKHSGHKKPGTDELTFGYVTVDSCPGTGDDTLHTLPPSYDIPDYMMSTPPNVTDATPIDLVFVDFIETPVLNILNELQNEKTYSKEDVSLYSPVMSNQVFGLYAQAYWN